MHIACHYKDKQPSASAVGYANNKVRFVGIPPFGGDGFSNKLNVITTAFSDLSIISKELRTADIFHFRAPTSIGLYIIPYLSLFSSKKGWYKYAGNWMAKSPPASYTLQRWMLLHLQKRKITINGYWPDQPAKCITFANPCLYDADRNEGALVVEHKVFNRPYRLCFAGRLDKEKGLYKILDAIRQNLDKTIFECLDIVGDGPEMHTLKDAAKDIGIPVNIYGALGREELFKLYERSHFILLPSDSEGFPKVIAEAANFGCIPIVSNISAISQYVNNSNGFLWDAGKDSFPQFFASLDLSDEQQLQQKAKHAHQMAASFTYTYYIDSLKKNILG